MTSKKEKKKKKKKKKKKYLFIAQKSTRVMNIYSLPQSTETMFEYKHLKVCRSLR